MLVFSTVHTFVERVGTYMVHYVSYYLLCRDYPSQRGKTGREMWWRVCPFHVTSRSVFFELSEWRDVPSREVCFYRHCNTVQWNIRSNGETPSSFVCGLERMQPYYSQMLQGRLRSKVTVREVAQGVHGGPKGDRQ